MTIKVLFFSLFRDITGVEEMTLELPGTSATVEAVLSSLYGEFGTLRDWEEKMLIAVNCEYADSSAPLSDGDELALMPPVQGG